MLGEIVITIIILPLRAVVLWVLSGLGAEQHSYIKALRNCNNFYHLYVIKFSRLQRISCFDFKFLFSGIVFQDYFLIFDYKINL